MTTWQEQLKRSAVDPAVLEPDPTRLGPRRRAAAAYPMRCPPFYLDLCRKGPPALRRQILPDPRELDDPEGWADPLGEADHSPVPGVVHRHPDRALLLVTTRCAVHCRFCFRRHRLGRGGGRPATDLEAALAYIRTHREIREVILSGGDPLVLDDGSLDAILRRLRRLDHLEVLRIHSRVPVVLPQRLTAGLAAVLRRAAPLYLVVHVNHPAELTPEMDRGCGMLLAAGLPLASHTVLLRGVNDDLEILRCLFQGLQRRGIRPYYLFHPDLARGTAHFRPPLTQGLDLVRRLSRRLGGLARPAYAVDIPGGYGKVLLHPGRVRERDGQIFLEDDDGVLHPYPPSRRRR